MIRALIFVFLLGCSVEANEQLEERKELTPLFINPMIELERFGACKHYAEAVYQDLITGMTMTHPEAENKEKAAFEFMKDAFIECFKPFKST